MNESSWQISALIHPIQSMQSIQSKEGFKKKKQIEDEWILRVGIELGTLTLPDQCTNPIQSNPIQSNPIQSSSTWVSVPLKSKLELNPIKSKI